MKRMFGFIGIIVGTQFIVSSAIADTTYVSGVISTNTVWDTTGSPYIVTGDVLIDSAVTLDIEPGVEVRIDSVKHIMIKGTLNAVGTATDSIIISALDTTKRWSRLWFKPASAGSLKYCRIEYAGNSAIFDSTASSLVIEYNTITHNHCIWNGGGIRSSGSPIISANAITENSAFEGGGVWSDSLPIINGNTIKGNFANSGGGIWSDGSPTISDNIITENSATVSGGGISIYDSSTISGNTIKENLAGWGGGIYNWYGSPTISGNTITDNSANHKGGGIWSLHGSPAIRENAIAGNSAESGGGVYSYGFSTISENTITQNTAVDWGGGIYSEGIATINSNTITENFADYGSSIFGFGLPTIKYNTITDTTASTIYIALDSAIIDSNNIYATGYAVYNDSGSNIDARYNYWGTASNDTIEMKIWDFYDDDSLGIVYYEPFLTESLEFGIEEREKLRVESLELRVFPNPSTTGVKVQWLGVSEGQEISLKVYDLGGRLVKTVLTTKQGVEINLEKLTNGIYFVRVETHTGLVTGDFKATKKIILMR